MTPRRRTTPLALAAVLLLSAGACSDGRSDPGKENLGTDPGAGGGGEPGDATTHPDGSTEAAGGARESGAGGEPGSETGGGGESGGGGAASGGGGGEPGASPAAGGRDGGVEADGGEPGEAGPRPACDAPGSRFATEAVSHAFGGGQNFGQAAFPAPVLGPPRGGGACQGSTDVVSLGNGGSVVLGFGDNAIVDGPGADFIVFENAFGSSCDPGSTFAELGTVSVSEDGVTWHDFSCTASEPPYGSCSGGRVVYANADSNAIDPLDPGVAGGDAYDLAELGVRSARFVKVTDRPDLTGPAGVYDLDAVAIVHALCP